MVGGFNLKLKGLKSAVDAMRQLGDDRGTDRRVNASMKKAAIPALDFAKSKVAVGDGDLRRSLIINSKKVKNGNRSVRVGPDSMSVQRLSGDENKFQIGQGIKKPANYAHLVEYGHRAWGKSFVKRRPFMRPAGTRFGGIVYIARVRYELDAAYRKLAKKLNKSK